MTIHPDLPIYTLPDGSSLVPYRNKNPGMIEILLGMGPTGARIKAKKCPLCTASIVPTDFRDDLSRQEFEVSALCQRCQDEAFGPEAA